MKPTPVDVISISTLSTPAIKMGIDASGMNALVRMLSDIYSDPHLAAVREYASNARDAHVEAGNKDPILVTSPGHLSPLLVVQDFGTGMSEETVLKVYSQYGASTKRDSNEMIGSFGIGAKSAFAAGEQFTVTSVFEGQKVIALFALDSDGAPTVNIVSRTETIEPNGTKVEIGVRNVDATKRAIDHLFQTWEPGTVLVDGVPPASVWNDLDRMTDDIHTRLGMAEDAGYHWVVVMGGVPYNVTQTAINALSSRAHQMARTIQNSQMQVYLSVAIGDVDITPSREELQVTPKTVATLTALIDKFSTEIGLWATKQVEDANSLIEAAIRMREIQSSLGMIGTDALRSVTWQGHQIPRMPVEFPLVSYFKLGRRGWNSPQTAQKTTGIRISPDKSLRRMLFVTDVPLHPRNRTRSVQLAAKQYLLAEAGKPDHRGKNVVVALTGPPASYVNGWFQAADSALEKTDFDTFVKQWKPKPTPGQGSTHTTVMYDVYNTSGSSQLSAADLNKVKGEVYYLTNSDQYTVRIGNPLLEDAVGNSPVICLRPTQKVEAFRKRVPAAKSARDATQEHARKLLISMTTQDVDAFVAQDFVAKVNYNSTIADFLLARRANITNLAVRDVLSEYERAMKVTSLQGDRAALLRAAAHLLNQDVAPRNKSSFDVGSWQRTLKSLPLLTTYFSRSWERSTEGDEHAILYINAVTI